jgi:integrase
VSLRRGALISQAQGQRPVPQVRVTLSPTMEQERAQTATINTGTQRRLNRSMLKSFSGFASPQLEEAEYERACLGGRCFPRPGDTEMLERCRHAYRMAHWIELFRRFHVSRLKDQYNLQCRLKYLDPFLHVKPKDLTRPVVIQWFHEIGRHSTCQANGTLSLLRTMFKCAEEWGLWDGDNPATRIKWFPRASRSRFVQPEEMPRLLESLAIEPVPVQTFFMTCLLTGCRGGEARVMRWTDVNLTQGIWSKPTTKTGKPHVVPLPPALVQMLKSLPQRGPWVFTRVKSVDMPLSKSVSFFWWRQIRKRAGLPDVTIHDLRRTCASYLAISGENLAVLARVLNHTTLANTAIYARLNLAPVQSALFQHANTLLGMGSPQHAVPQPQAVKAMVTARPPEEACEWPG